MVVNIPEWLLWATGLPIAGAALFCAFIGIMFIIHFGR